MFTESRDLLLDHFINNWATKLLSSELEEVVACRPGALSKNSRSSFSKSPPALVVTSSKSIGMAVVAVEDDILESTQERGSRPDSLEVLGVFGASKAFGVSAAVELAPPGVEAAKDGVGDVGLKPPIPKLPAPIFVPWDELCIEDEAGEPNINSSHLRGTIGLETDFLCFSLRYSSKSSNINGLLHIASAAVGGPTSKEEVNGIHSLPPLPPEYSGVLLGPTFKINFKRPILLLYSEIKVKKVLVLIDYKISFEIFEYLTETDHQMREHFRLVSLRRYPNGKIIASNNEPQCILTGIYKIRQTLLMSPNYTNSYFANTCWDYIIRSPYRCPTKFHIEFLDFFLPPSTDCVNNYLAIGLEDKLCGQIVGIKKYQTSDGILRLRLVINNSSYSEDKSFKLLITRLACEREDLFSESEIETNTETGLITALPEYLQPPSIEKEDKFCQQGLPSHVPAPAFASTIGEQLLIEPLRSSDDNNACCVNPFHQRNFYLTNPGFPRSMFSAFTATLQRDCEYRFIKFSPNVCRLRLNLKIFNFGQYADVNEPCGDDFIEIDNQRFCGCLTGWSYSFDWFAPAYKVMRMRLGYGSSLIGGFLIEVIQEDCFENRFLRSDFLKDFYNHQLFLQLPLRTYPEQPGRFNIPHPPSADFSSINKAAARRPFSNIKFNEYCLS
uniref:CUB domain-containing protein n=1 Tax=Glossina brevipalpis TaxID=37001 RepID=A0A1A9W1U9_9MUSC